MSDEWMHRLHPEKCADHGHPGAAYNPLGDKTWCLCGARTYPGDAVDRTDSSLGPADCGPSISRVIAHTRASARSGLDPPSLPSASISSSNAAKASQWTTRPCS